MWATIQSILSAVAGYLGIAGSLVSEHSGAISVILTLVVGMFGLESKARDAIAVVGEIKSNMEMTPEQALEEAAKWMGKSKWLAWIPLNVRKWFVQIIFDSMKKAIASR